MFGTVRTFLGKLTEQKNLTGLTPIISYLKGLPPKFRPDRFFCSVTLFSKSSQGGGLLLNRLASDIIQFFIKITPKISIDDALIGIIMKDRGSGTK